MNKQQLIESKNKSRKRGIILTGLTLLSVIGIFFKLLDLSPTQENDFSNTLVRITYSLSPDIASFKEMINILINKEGGELLTLPHGLAVLIVVIFMLGSSYIGAWSRMSDRYNRLQREADDDNIRGDM